MKQQCIMLNGDWEMKSADGKIMCAAKIPGSVLSAAIDQGALADPYWRTNEYAARDFLRQDFIFTKTFCVEKKDGFFYELCCDGIDTVADIFLNGKLLKRVQNMHLSYRVPCTDFLRRGVNELKIKIWSPIRYIEEYTPSPGKEITYTPCGAMEKNQYIRKAHSMFGWDWGPQLPDMGIWRDIWIRGFTGAVISDVKIRQKHENGKVEVSAELFVKLSTKDAYFHEASILEAKKRMPHLQEDITLETPDGDVLHFIDGRCTVEAPKLWWPNRYGKQPLYTLKAAVSIDGELVSEKQCRIGLRTLSVSRQKDAWGEEFAFQINGVKIFAKGANYIPQDCVYSRITSDKIHALLGAAAECGFNCIRVWGGGYYPSQEFYDCCDELGLIVWQDFMFACNIYDLTQDLRQSIKDEVRDNVRRLRHHASLGLWCGNNEIESAWRHWEGFRGHSKLLRQDYLTIFENLIPDTLHSEQEDAFYWPSSPSCGGQFLDPDSDDAGDRHYWDVWHGEKPFSDYERYYFRFCSEFGFQSFPEMKTIQAFTEKSDRNIFSEVMESHQKNGAANGKILKYISDNFLYPKDLDSLVYISQILQGVAIKEGVEHWRRHRGRCMGAIYWQLNDNWPVASWSSIDYFGRWKALQYMARHFYADILGGIKVDWDKALVRPFIQNETMRSCSTNLCLSVKDMDGNTLYAYSVQAECGALGVLDLEPVFLKLSELQKREPVFQDDFEDIFGYIFVEALFQHSDGTVSHQVKMKKPYKHMHIKKANISCHCRRDGDFAYFTLQSDAPAFFVEIQTDVDMVLSDNFMHLTDAKQREVTGRLPEGYPGLPKVRVRSLCDSYAF